MPAHIEVYADDIFQQTQQWETTIAKMSDSEHFEWPAPWLAIAADEQRDKLTAELLRELCDRHVLWGKRLVVIARRVDRDDILVRVEEGVPSYAEVHLTWALEKSDPRWPRTRAFQSLDDWQQHFVAD